MHIIGTINHRVFKYKKQKNMKQKYEANPVQQAKARSATASIKIFHDLKIEILPKV